MGTRRRLDVGERGPDFLLSGPSGSPTRFYAHAGGSPVALVFAHDDADPRMAKLIGHLAEREDVAVTSVAERSVAEVYGVDPGRPTVVVLDPSLRVTGIVTIAPGEDAAPEVIALLDAEVHRGPPTEVRDQAPVLFVPRVLDAVHRDRLIQVMEREGDVETGVERGSRGEELDRGYKRRRDHTVSDPDLLRELSSAVGRRIMPEIQRAFAFRATRFEGFKIACYDASTGGFFRSHRDNLNPSTAHRVFALTLNLNDAYEGGQLRFPEYGNQLYRPDAGAALVFSCAHLHEVRDVTVGRRFVLLSFLYGEPASSTARPR